MKEGRRPFWGLVTALQIEFDAIRRVMEDLPGEKQSVQGEMQDLGGRPALFGRLGDKEAVLICASWGKTMAASAAQAVIDACRPQVVLDCGTAGGLMDGMRIGQIVVATSVRDSQIPGERASRLLVPGGLTGDLCAALEKAGGDPLGGPFLTCERSIRSEDERKRLGSEGFLAVNWESFAVLKVCQVNGVASSSIRVVSDLGDERAEEDFKAQSHLVMNRLARALCTGLSNFLPSAAHGPCFHPPK